MFPCTAGVNLFPCCVDIHGIVSTHVETVALLLREEQEMPAGRACSGAGKARGGERETETGGK